MTAAKTGRQTGFERAMGMRGYLGSPAAAEDRRDGLVVGGKARWLVTGPEMIGTISRIDIDKDGDPWFTLTFDGDHKDVKVDRATLAKAEGRS